MQHHTVYWAQTDPLAGRHLVKQHKMRGAVRASKHVASSCLWNSNSNSLSYGGECSAEHNRCAYM